MLFVFITVWVMLFVIIYALVNSLGTISGNPVFENLSESKKLVGWFSVAFATAIVFLSPFATWVSAFLYIFVLVGFALLIWATVHAFGAGFSSVNAVAEEHHTEMLAKHSQFKKIRKSAKHFNKLLKLDKSINYKQIFEHATSAIHAIHLPDSHDDFSVPKLVGAMQTIVNNLPIFEKRGMKLIYTSHSGMSNSVEGAEGAAEIDISNLGGGSELIATAKNKMESIHNLVVPMWRNSEDRKFVDDHKKTIENNSSALGHDFSIAENELNQMGVEITNELKGLKTETEIILNLLNTFANDISYKHLLNLKNNMSGFVSRIDKMTVERGELEGKFDAQFGDFLNAAEDVGAINSRIEASVSHLKALNFGSDVSKTKVDDFISLFEKIWELLPNHKNAHLLRFIYHGVDVETNHLMKTIFEKLQISEHTLDAMHHSKYYADNNFVKLIQEEYAHKGLSMPPDFKKDIDEELKHMDVYIGNVKSKILHLIDAIHNVFNDAELTSGHLNTVKKSKNVLVRDLENWKKSIESFRKHMHKKHKADVFDRDHDLLAAWNHKV